MDTKAEEEEEVLYEELDADSVDTVNLLSSFGLADSIISNFLGNSVLFCFTLGLCLNVFLCL